MTELHEKLLKAGFDYIDINPLTGKKIYQDDDENQIEILPETYLEGEVEE